jgi:hypothetical protein
MGKYLDLLKQAEGYDINDKNDKSPSPHAAVTPFGRFNRFCRTFCALESRCPEHVPVARWQQCVEDGRAFLARWGEQAQALGWTARDLFGLQKPPPMRPHPSYSRLSRYDETGLIWLLQGRKVVALTEVTAAIQNPTGNITAYRRHSQRSGRSATAWTISSEDHCNDV